MKKLLGKIKKFFKEGWYKFEVVNAPKTFGEYFIHFPINWGVTLGLLLFIGIIREGAIRYESPLIGTIILFPIIILAYHIVDEYFAFQYFKLPEYMKSKFDRELDKNFAGTDYYWERVHKFEKDHNISPLTDRHNGVIGRKVSAKTLQGYAKWSITAVLAYMAIRIFITG